MICFRPWLFTSVFFNFPSGKFTQPLASSKQTKTFVYYLSFYVGYGLFFLCGSSLTRFRTLSAILGTSLCATGNTCSIKCTAYNVITHTRKVLHTTATNQHDGVFLQVVSFARNVRVHLFTIGQTHTSYLTHS